MDLKNKSSIEQNIIKLKNSKFNVNSNNLNNINIPNKNKFKRISQTRIPIKKPLKAYEILNTSCRQIKYNLENDLSFKDNSFQKKNSYSETFLSNRTNSNKSRRNQEYKNKNFLESDFFKSLFYKNSLSDGTDVNCLNNENEILEKEKFLNEFIKNNLINSNLNEDEINSNLDEEQYEDKSVYINKNNKTNINNNSSNYDSCREIINFKKKNKNFEEENLIRMKKNSIISKKDFKEESKEFSFNCLNNKNNKTKINTKNSIIERCSITHIDNNIKILKNFKEDIINKKSMCNNFSSIMSFNRKKDLNKNFEEEAKSINMLNRAKTDMYKHKPQKLPGSNTYESILEKAKETNSKEKNLSQASKNSEDNLFTESFNENHKFNRIKNMLKNNILLTNSKSKGMSLEIKTNEIDKYEKSRKLMKKSLIYDSLSDDEFQLLADKRSTFHPNSKIKIFIDFLVFIVLIYSMIYLPIRLIYTESASIDNLILESVFDCIYISDFFLSFFIGFYDFEENYITNKVEIFFNYYRTNFLTDLLSGIPFNSISELNSILKRIDNINILYINYLIHESYKEIDIISENNNQHLNSDEGSISSFLTYNENNYRNIFRIFRVIKFLKVIKKNSFLNIIYTKFKLEYKLGGAVNRLLFFFLYFLLMSHILTCIFIFLGSLKNPNWIVSLNLQNSSFADIYVTSLYFNHATIFTIGYGDVLSKNMYERLYNILLMVVGIALYSFTITSISNIIQQQDEKTKIYLKNMEYFNELSTKYSIKRKLADKVRRYFKYDMNSNKNDKNELLKELPLSLRNEMIICMYKNIINSFVFFKNFDSLDFVIKAIMSFKPVKSIRHEILVKESEFIEEIIFIKKGILSLEIKLHIKGNNKSTKSKNIVLEEESLSENKKKTINFKKPNKEQNIKNKSKKDSKKDRKIIFDKMDILKNEEFLNLKIIELRKNEHFGDVLIFLNKRSPLSVRTRSNTAELFLMKKTDLLNLTSEYPEFFEEIYSNSSFNMNQIKLFIKKAKKIYLEKMNKNFINREVIKSNLMKIDSKDIFGDVEKDNEKNNNHNFTEIKQNKSDRSYLNIEYFNKNSKFANKKNFINITDKKAFQQSYNSLDNFENRNFNKRNKNNSLKEEGNNLFKIVINSDTLSQNVYTNENEEFKYENNNIKSYKDHYNLTSFVNNGKKNYDDASLSTLIYNQQNETISRSLENDTVNFNSKLNPNKNPSNNTLSYSSATSFSEYDNIAKSERDQMKSYLLNNNIFSSKYDLKSFSKKENNISENTFRLKEDSSSKEKAEPDNDSLISLTKINVSENPSKSNNTYNSNKNIFFDFDKKNEVKETNNSKILEVKDYPFKYIFNIDNTININNSGNLILNQKNNKPVSKFSLNNLVKGKDLIKIKKDIDSDSSNTVIEENSSVYQNPFSSDRVKLPLKINDLIFEIAYPDEFTISTEDSSPNSKSKEKKSFFENSYLEVNNENNIFIEKEYESNFNLGKRKNDIFAYSRIPDKENYYSRINSIYNSFNNKKTRTLSDFNLISSLNNFDPEITNLRKNNFYNSLYTGNESTFGQEKNFHINKRFSSLTKNSSNKEAPEINDSKKIQNNNLSVNLSGSNRFKRSKSNYIIRRKEIPNNNKYKNINKKSILNSKSVNLKNTNLKLLDKGEHLCNTNTNLHSETNNFSNNRVYLNPLNKSGNLKLENNLKHSIFQTRINGIIENFSNEQYKFLEKKKSPILENLIKETNFYKYKAKFNSISYNPRGLKKFKQVSHNLNKTKPNINNPCQLNNEIINNISIKEKKNKIKSYKKNIKSLDNIFFILKNLN